MKIVDTKSAYRGTHVAFLASLHATSGLLENTQICT